MIQKNLKINQFLALVACLAVLALPVLNALIVEPGFSAFFKDVAEKKLIRVASQMTGLLEYDQNLTMKTPLSDEFLIKLESVRDLLEMRKVKVFTPEGQILHSSDAKDIGNFTRHNFFPELIENQQTRTWIKHQRHPETGEEQLIVEIYVPIVKKARAIGAFELYYDMTNMKRGLARVIGKINMVVIASSLLLLAAVLVSAYLSRRSYLLWLAAEGEKDRLITELTAALNEVKTLRGILPVCSFCKKIRDDSGYWEQVDVYLQQHSGADISHGICPSCAEEHYPEIYQKIKARQDQN